MSNKTPTIFDGFTCIYEVDDIAPGQLFHVLPSSGFINARPTTYANIEDIRAVRYNGASQNQGWKFEFIKIGSVVMFVEKLLVPQVFQRFSSYPAWFHDPYDGRMTLYGFLHKNSVVYLESACQFNLYTMNREQ